MNPNSWHILVIDDQQAIAEMVAEFLESQGYVCTFTSEPAEGLRLLEEHDFDLVITDLMMGEVSGMEVLAGAHREGRKRASVILMTGFPTIENAIEALKQGAEDYLLKPFSLNALEIVVERVFDQIRLTRENVNLKESLALFRASEALEEPLDLPQYLDMVLDVAVQELGSSSANLVLFEQHEGIVREGERIHRGVPCPDLEEAGAVLSLASELSEASSEHVLNARMGGIPMLALPLRAGGDLVGLIAICREARESPFTPAEAKALAIIGSGAAVAIKNARLYNSLQEQYLGAVQALVAAVEAKDPYTCGHSEMVSRYGLLLAQHAGFDTDFVESIRVAGLLHDAGKIGIPERILLKPGALTGQEYDVIKSHVEMSERIVRPLDLSSTIMEAISQHHERIDGSGYPRSLGGEQVGPAGRVLAIADSYDALVSDRVYRTRMDSDGALETLEQLAPEKLDADLFACFRTLIARHNRGEVEIPVAHT